jgi:hypothetical protein
MQEAERYRVAQIKSQTSNLLKRTGWLLAGATRARPAAQTATLWRSRAAMSVSRTTAAGTRQRHRTASKRRMRKRPFVFMRQCRLNPNICQDRLETNIRNVERRRRCCREPAHRLRLRLRHRRPRHRPRHHPRRLLLGRSSVARPLVQGASCM